MKFYEIDQALQEAIVAADTIVRLCIHIDTNGTGRFERVCEQDIIDAQFFCSKEAAGGTATRGEILLDNTLNPYNYANTIPGSAVQVSFSLGDGLPYFQRFILYIDHNGIQDIRGPGRKRLVRIGLRDLSAKLRKTDTHTDWTNPAVFTYSVVCDKSQPEKSLVHGIAHKAGLTVNDIACSTIPVTLPYVRLRRTIWAELSDLAKTYRCHVECTPEKPLVFIHSPYQTEPLDDNTIPYTLNGNEIFYMRTTAQGEYYRNTIRLQFLLPAVLPAPEHWQYDDQFRLCCKSDGEAVRQYGTAALNVTGSYFSEYIINGKPQYEDWVLRELADRKQRRCAITVKTHKALFHARVGANVKLVMSNEELGGIITSLSLRYRRDKAFVTTFKLSEQI